ncbi:MAG TPA: type II secretion system protein [Gemmatimonadaceae bacterium]|nr:type II secretion system protein [Gemmatimonadaceae bacterium]
MPSKHSPGPRRRAGFTLVELLVAIVLIDCGVLALVAESAVLVRKRNDLRTHALATRVAGDRVQSLAAGACAETVGSAEWPGGMRESWSVALVPNHVRELSDSVAFVEGRATRSVVLRTRLPC